MKALAGALLLVAVFGAPAAQASAPEVPAVQGAKPVATPAKKPAEQKSQARQADAKPGAARPPQPLSATVAPAGAPFRWDVPGLIAWVDSAGVQISDGVPLTLQVARSSFSVEALLQHFADSFQKAGLFIPPGPEQLRAFQEPQLTALDPERLIAYTVIFQANPDDTVTLILGTSDLAHYNPRGAAALLWAPLPPGAQQMMHTQMEGGQSAVFSVSSSKEAVMAFYRDAMKQAGFEEEEPGIFRRGAEVIQVYAQRQEGQLAVSLTRHMGMEEELEGPR